MHFRRNSRKIQGHKCTELAEKSWRLAESIEYIWNAEILNPQIRETVSKAFIRICIGCGSMYLQNVQEEHINPEQIQEAAEEISLLLYHYSDLLLPEEMPVYQIPIYQTLQIANMRLERKENALYYAQKGVVLCDLFSAGQNAQLNGLIQDSKNMFQQYINQNVPAASRPAKGRGFSPGSSRDSRRKAVPKESFIFLEARFIRCLHIPQSCFE